MGKVKNLIWEEIGHDTECSMTSPIQPIPTPEELRIAELATLDTWLEYIIADKADQDDRWADYQSAIEHHNLLEFRRNQAMLKEVACPSI